MSRHLHIVCLDAPYPSDCSQSIDTFEKISALHKCGVKIHLHCFESCTSFGELNSRCESIQIHCEKNIGNIIKSLNEKEFPILIEDIYDPTIFHSIKQQQRKIVLRIRNANFYKQKTNILDKILPAKLLQSLGKKNRAVLPANFLYACISPNFVTTLQQKYHLPHVDFLPPFVGWHDIKSEPGIGNFCLYHGDLSDENNEKMAAWLLEKIFSEIRFPFVIAGKNPTRRMSKLTNLYSHACIVANPAKREIDELIQKAHINIVPSFQSGKIYKLLHSLFEGRHCITNDTAVRHTNLAEACHIANDSQTKIMVIKKLMSMPFTHAEIECRKKILLPQYNNQKNVSLLLDWLYD